MKPLIAGSQESIGQLDPHIAVSGRRGQITRTGCSTLILPSARCCSCDAATPSTTATFPEAMSELGFSAIL